MLTSIVKLHSKISRSVCDGPPFIIHRYDAYFMGFQINPITQYWIFATSDWFCTGGSHIVMFELIIFSVLKAWQWRFYLRWFSMDKSNKEARVHLTPPPKVKLLLTYHVLLTWSGTLPCSPNSLPMVSKAISTHGSQTSSPVAVNLLP